MDTRLLEFQQKRVGDKGGVNMLKINTLVKKIVKWLKTKYCIFLFRQIMKRKGKIDLYDIEYFSRGGFGGKSVRGARFSYKKDERQIKYEEIA